MYIAAVRCIFQCVGYDILQNGIHLVLVQPYVQITETAFVGQVDVFYVCVWTECIDCLLHICAQFVFGYV